MFLSNPAFWLGVAYGAAVVAGFGLGILALRIRLLLRRRQYGSAISARQHAADESWRRAARALPLPRPRPVPRVLREAREAAGRDEREGREHA